MPLHDVGYRRWDGREAGFTVRWWAITNKGFEIALRSQWVRRMMFLAWLPAVYFGGAIFFFERSLESGGAASWAMELSELVSDEENLVADRQQRQATRVLQRVPLLGGLLAILGDTGSNRVITALLSGDDVQLRRVAWSWFILKFLNAPQGIALLLLLGWVAPPLIAKDLRTKAYLLYFSRPLSKLNYIVGKVMVLVILCSVITTLPALLLYACGVGLSPNMQPLYETWDLPLRIIVVSAIHALPACLLALMLSALTTESRYAMFSWYAIWSLGFVTWRLLDYALKTHTAELQEREIDPLTPVPLEEGGAWMFVSLFDTIASAQVLAMGVSDEVWQPRVALLLLGALCLFCLAVIWWRLNQAARG